MHSIARQKRKPAENHKICQTGTIGHKTGSGKTPYSPDQNVDLVEEMAVGTELGK